MTNRLCGYVVAGVIGGLACAGCAGIQKNADLERARAAYAEAKKDPAVSAQAPVALYDAEKELKKAEAAWERAKDKEAVAHLSYLAERKVEIALAVAQRKEAEGEIQRLAGVREKQILEGRTREAELGRLKAKEAGELAEVRAREAEQARLEALKARGLAETKAQEAELARIEALRAKETAETKALEVELALKEKEEATTRLQELEQQLVEMKAKRTSRGLVLTLEGVLFEVNKADLKPGAQRNLEKLVAFLQENPERKIAIEGHTDNTGSESYNIQLSQLRAEAVRDFIVRAGVSGDRVGARGLGEGYPVASNQSEAGRQQNRRVEIIVLDEE